MTHHRMTNASEKDKFDGTKLRIEGRRPQTTTYGIDWHLSVELTDQNHAETGRSATGFLALYAVSRLHYLGARNAAGEYSILRRAN